MSHNPRILRVFPRRTNATPTDDMVRIGEPGLFDPPECDEVHVSVTFTWDKSRAVRYAESWRRLGLPVKIGGPIFGDAGEFESGRYLREGHVITSRGCPNRCWFCMVPEREGGKIRELPICDGWKIHDSNLLACSDEHIQGVFTMLHRQPKRPEFLGGLEAARLQPWQLIPLRELKPRRTFFAYDTPDDLEPLRRAGQWLRDMPELYCYVLMGYLGDTFEKAEQRCQAAIAAGFMPYGMLYRDNAGRVDRQWRRFQREWVRPQIVRAKMKAALPAEAAQDRGDEHDE